MSKSKLEGSCHSPPPFDSHTLTRSFCIKVVLLSEVCCAQKQMATFNFMLLSLIASSALVESEKSA